MNMLRETRRFFPPPTEEQAAKWARRRDIPLAILAWIALIAVILWAASHIIRAILLLAIAALFAYALAPVVKLLERIMPRLMAILIVYLVILGAISVFFYLIAIATVHQTFSLIHSVQGLLNPNTDNPLRSIEQGLAQFGITPGQIAAARQQMITQAGDFAKNSVPYLRSLADFAIDTIVVAVLSIYLLIDGSRFVSWVRRNAPRLTRANFLLDTLQRVVGGYIRGQLTLAVLIALLVGIGMQFIFQLPYAIFLGALAFAMAFIPVLGTLVSGAVCVLIGLTKGWPIAVGVLVYFVIVHVIESEVVGPRIVGKAVGLHPIASLFALVAGAELFGIWGALFASPIAGVLQAILISVWTEWRQGHPEQFQRTGTLPLEPLEQEQSEPHA
ncbi:AI-2E family transporter [Ktedonosporobacter rubrisoli]|uniref:AI-2E family transporter n=1 Tax=Ktedonosporobacter rubrisoli TaxID=2509675 RepID=A0A4V0YZG3_KTERU|nr:AI-2E family transporter [Ktedonosporobacter rubrisoli]QBD79621.1 AI-2E family transporter [Ktedonosporobacter rubrisoli]